MLKQVGGYSFDDVPDIYPGKDDLYSLRTMSKQETISQEILHNYKLNNTEYKGKFEGLDKNFNFTLNKCSRLSIFDLIFHSNHYEIIFIRGENIINFIFSCISVCNTNDFLICFFYFFTFILNKII